MLIIPDMPSGSYFADGFVITSMVSIELAGMVSNTPERPDPVIEDGRPSINIVTFALPLKLTFPSISIVIDGTF